MSLTNYYGPNKFGLSFELFPPRTPKGEQALVRHVSQLAELNPSFITCTYGAGGSTQSKTLEIAEMVKRQFNIPVASHLTCVGASADDLRDYLNRAARQGVDYIVALRGDPPKGEKRFRAVEGGFSYASELVQLLRAEFPQFGVAVAGYPEKHVEAPSHHVDLQNLARKVACGADIVVTQLFYNNDDFFHFRQRYEELGITAPLVPGILPITNLAQAERLTSMCHARLPEHLVQQLKRKDDPNWQLQVGIDFAIEQVRELLEKGVAGLHFYVLNKSEATSAVLHAVQQLK
jgi:methylenetetrahydrofolate reductase (NADPH)